MQIEIEWSGCSIKSKKLLINIITIILELIGFIGLVVLIVLSSIKDTYYVGYSNQFWGFIDSQGFVAFFYTFVILMISGILLLVISSFNKNTQ